jgi:hypothetical protein
LQSFGDAPRRTSFSAREKLTVARAVEECKDVKKVSDEYYPTLSAAAFESRRKLVLKWVREKKKLEAQWAAKDGSNKRKARPIGVGTKLPAAAELELVKWVNDLRKEGVPISTLMLTLEAKELADEYGIADFEGSWSWLKGFKALHESTNACGTEDAGRLGRYCGQFCRQGEGHNEKSRHQKGL